MRHPLAVGEASYAQISSTHPVTYLAVYTVGNALALSGPRRSAVLHCPHAICDTPTNSIGAKRGPHGRGLLLRDQLWQAACAIVSRLRASAQRHHACPRIRLHWTRQRPSRHGG